MRGFLALAAVTMLLGLPLVGAWAAGMPFDKLFEFPPCSRYVEHAPFSWVAFGVFAGLIAGSVTPFLVRALHAGGGPRRPRKPRAFPGWGWAGLAWTAAAWGLAWSRFAWFETFQRHTFVPLWLGYIVVVNALAYRRTGRCLMRNRPGFFLVLFPASAAFWWYFEYLNRFVQNWRYVGAEYPAGEYFVLATLSFSTVLAAVLSTREWLQSFAVFEAFRSFRPVRFRRPRRVAAAVLVLAGAGLACVGAFPDYLFPLLWVSPLLIAVSVLELAGRRHVFSSVASGDWRPVVTAAAAALVCGFFWEMWNVHSLAKWTYEVPFVQSFHVFEMPILGYAGYLPFGLECAVLGDLLGGGRGPAQ